MVSRSPVTPQSNDEYLNDRYVQTVP